MADVKCEIHENSLPPGEVQVTQNLFHFIEFTLNCILYDFLRSHILLSVVIIDEYFNTLILSWVCLAPNLSHGKRWQTFAYQFQSLFKTFKTYYSKS